MIVIQQPLYFLALLGLLVPIAIHLWNKKEGKVLKVGTVRWMQKRSSSKISKIKFHDWLLFLIRCALICFVVLILAQLLLKRSSENKILKWALVDSNIDLNSNYIKQLTDSLQGIGVEVRELNLGFKKIGIDSDHPTRKTLYNTWSVLKTAESLEDRPDSIMVITKTYIKNFSGIKPELNIPISWMTIPDQNPALFIHEARLLNSDSLMIKIGKSENGYTQIADFVTDSQNPALSKPPGIEATVSLNIQGDSLELHNGTKITQVKAINSYDSLQVLMLYDKETKKEVIYWEAGLRALSRHQKTPLLLETVNLDENGDGSLSNLVVDWLIVLEDEGSYNKEIAAEKVFVKAVSNDSLNNKWFTLKEKKDREIYSINNSFINDNGLLESFPGAILEVFQSGSDSSLWSNDIRTIAFDQMDVLLAKNVEEIKTEQNFFDQKPDVIFWTALLILLLVERLISLKRELS